MALEVLSPATMSFYAPRFEVEIDNQSVPINISKSMIDLTVEEKIEEGASFSITMHDEFDMSTQEFRWLDHRLFTVGNKITIRMGYASNLYTMLKGNITSLEPSFFAGETPTLTIGGQDLSYDHMKRTAPERTFVDKAYSDIARIIASEAGLLAVVDDTGTYERVCRKDSNKSYFAFLDELAKRVDRKFYMDGQTMYFVKPKDEKKEIMTLELGKDIISFRPTFKTTGLVSEVEVRAHNPRDPGTPIKGSAKAGDERNQEPGKKSASQVIKERHGGAKKVITNVIANSKQHADAIARSVLNKLSDTLIEGAVECVGMPQIRTGVNVRLDGMGKRFSDKYYVKGTKHTINNSGYRMRFDVKSNSVKRDVI